jgi:hypothetical protein
MAAPARHEALRRINIAAHIQMAAPTIQLASGQQIPAVGLGTLRSSKGVVCDAVKSAVAQGYRLIDCAEVYGNEAEVRSPTFDVVYYCCNSAGRSALP